MKTSPTAPAIVLTAQDLPQPSGRTQHSYECDCACPSPAQTTYRPFDRLSSNDRQALTPAPGLIEVPLDAEHTALFDPFGQGGVVVLNHAARQILSAFDPPASLAQASQYSAEPFAATLEKFLQLGLLQAEGDFYYPQFQPDRSLSVWLQITNACNLSCPYCYIPKNGGSMSEATGRAALEAVFRSAQMHGFEAVRLKYSGGEPSLKGRLVLALHDHARQLADRAGVELHDVLLSNGVSLSPRFIQELKARDLRVTISLDGIGGFHDLQRPFVSGSGSFPKVKQTIQNLIAAGLPPHLSITLTRRNLGGLPEVVRYALAHDLTFSFNFYRETHTGDGSLRLDEQALIAALREAFRVIEAQLPPWSLLGMILDRAQLLAPRQRACGVGQSYIVVDHLGRVAQCHMQIEQALGDVFSADPLQIIQRGAMQNIAVDEKDGCQECQWRYWCAGGCTLIAPSVAGDRHPGRSPYCNIYKAIYPQAIRLEGLRLLKYAEACLH